MTSVVCKLGPSSEVSIGVTVQDALFANGSLWPCVAYCGSELFAALMASALLVVIFGRWRGEKERTTEKETKIQRLSLSREREDYLG